MNKKEIIKKILKYYLITRIFLIFLVFLDSILLKVKYPDIPNIFYLWDGEHYLSIAENGYTLYYHYAFFPMIPLLIRYLGKVGFLLLNQVCVILTSYLFYKIGDKYLKLKNPFVPIIFWLMSPIAGITLVFYTEALFIFLTTLSYYLYKEKKYYLALGIVIGLCSIVRSTGSILFFSIFIMMLIDLFKKNIKFKNIIITYIPATLVSCTYPIYLYFKTGNPFKFIEVQSYWLKESSNIFRILYDVVVKTINEFEVIWTINSIFTIIIYIYIIRYIIKNYKEKKYRDLFIYSIMTLFMISFTIKGNGDCLTSYYRYISACFPVYFMFKEDIKTFMLFGAITIIITNFFFLNGYFF